MAENNKVQKLKTCCVCELLKNDSSFEKKINNMLKTDVSIKEIIHEFIHVKAPTKYFLEQHKINCLKDFIPERKVTNLKTSESCELIDDILNIDLDKFDSWDSIKKETECSRLLN